MSKSSNKQWKHTVFFGGLFCDEDMDVINELIELLFDGPPSKFEIQFVKDYAEMPAKNARGSHSFNGIRHQIFVCLDGINDCVRTKTPIGGNVTVASDALSATILVLAHEIRHASQAVFHGKIGNTAFRKGKYRGRPCEVDARLFVDEKYDEIMALIGRERIKPITLSGFYDGEIEKIIETFSYCNQISRDDIVKEIRLSKIKAPNVLSLIIDRLEKSGKTVCRT